MNLNATLTMVHVHDNYSGCLKKYHYNFDMHDLKRLFEKKKLMRYVSAQSL